MPLPAGSAPASEAPLRAAERIDVRRLGKASDDERAVLRVEWRAAQTGADEARMVDEMLDRLRRMQSTVTELGRLVRAMPQRAAPEPATVEPAEPAVSDKTLALAGAAAVGLLAIWWSRRRERAAAARPVPATTGTATPSPTPPAPAPPSAPLPESRPAPHPVAATAGPAARTGAAPAGVAPRGATPAPMQSSSPAATRPAAAVPDDELKPEPAAPAAPATAPVLEFTLEEADPETVARANARQHAARQARKETPATAPGNGTAGGDPTLELAGIMLSLGLEQSAAQTLVEYTEANPRQAIHHWLKLLDIYRHGGHRDDFRETAEKLRRNFNIHAEAGVESAGEAAPTLERYPHLAQRIQQLWPQRNECANYLKNLLEDNRDGARAGFPLAVAEEILLLQDIQKELTES